VKRSPHVRICVSAGLGNQLFQLACGIASAQRFNRHLILDSTWYHLQTYVPRRHFLLGQLFDLNGTPYSRASNLTPFTIHHEVASLQGILASFAQKIPILKKVLINTGTYIFEKHLHARSEELYAIELPKNVTLSGFWQTVDHFLLARRELLQILKPQFVPCRDFLHLQEKIQSSSNPVSIHVRRGDFLRFNEGKSVLTSKFYKAATDYIISSGISNPTWYIFSEDQDWCRSNFSFLERNVNFIQLCGENADIEELLLLKECRAGAILSNSSFSWWGAALSNNQAKVVVTSRYRHGPGQGDFQHERLLPNWVTINQF